MESNELTITVPPKNKITVPFSFNPSIVQLVNTAKDSQALCAYYLDKELDICGIIGPETCIVIDKNMWPMGEHMILSEIELESSYKHPLTIKIKYMGKKNGTE